MTGCVGHRPPNHVAWPIAAELETLLCFDAAESIARLDADNVGQRGRFCRKVFEGPSRIAARYVQAPDAVAHTPLPMLASIASVVLLTVNVAAWSDPPNRPTSNPTAKPANTRRAIAVTANIFTRGSSRI